MGIFLNFFFKKLIPIPNRPNIIQNHFLDVLEVLKIIFMYFWTTWDESKKIFFEHFPSQNRRDNSKMSWAGKAWSHAMRPEKYKWLNTTYWRRKTCPHHKYSRYSRREQRPNRIPYRKKSCGVNFSRCDQGWDVAQSTLRTRGRGRWRSKRAYYRWSSTSCPSFRSPNR